MVVAALGCCFFLKIDKWKVVDLSYTFPASSLYFRKTMYIPLSAGMIHLFITKGKFQYIIWSGGSAPLRTTDHVNDA
jgi:hypothetical protein